MRIKFMFAWYDFWIGLFWDAGKRALYVFPIPMFGIRVNIWGRRCWVIRKRGLFYRPNDQGYTDRIEEAGRYTEWEAVRRVYAWDEPITMHHVSKFI